jgi:hypothetical protein
MVAETFIYVVYYFCHQPASYSLLVILYPQPPTSLPLVEFHYSISIILS